MAVAKVISGGQDGVDQGALDAAIAQIVEHGGTCPRGRRCESGTIPARFKLTEHELPEYPPRTRQNVEDSHGTLLVTCSGALTKGTALTRKLCIQYGKPWYHAWLGNGHRVNYKLVHDIRRWIRAEDIRILNVAGTRESHAPGIHIRTQALLVLCIGD